jgi:gamma-glutamyl:cysteine ligase YbdK (ATP-grasp superfamily)
MAEKVVVYWRDIPAQVIAKAGRRTARRQLPERFEQAIDRAAMRAGLAGTDAYLEQWRRADPVPCGDDLEAEAEAAAAALAAEYTVEKVRELVANGGNSA